MRPDYSKHKKAMRAVGIPLLVIGIVVLLYGFISFASPHPDDPKVGEPDFREKMDRSAERSLQNMLLFGAGGLLTMVGFMLVGLTLIRPYSKYLATEASPAIRIASESIGEGLKESGALGSKEPKEIIKIKCPHCGYLESEDAEFCSKCGDKI